jgi:hypothetical protein
MEMKNQLIATSAAAGSSSCHSASPGSGSWPTRRRGWVFGGAIIVIGTAVALSQHWLTVAALIPVLFVLPCAVMMFMCMKGMSHGQDKSAVQSSASTKTPIGTDATEP